ncbi:FOG: TPR repeat [Ceraceosorus bombacis]|uniref:FOG: TPR repeat n=1 Tax=Ceraceosorus bombacis TaxID=401625 RepID=A0A0P1BDL4_9BASI|nr:FOG: TPR repeat [Ceraceosorus bombacis]
MQKLAQANENAWISIGSAADAMEDFDRAIAAYEAALRHNPYSVPAISAIAGVHRTMDHFEKAVEYFQRVLNIVPENGETWGAMGHCYLMMDDLQKAYTAYQQALYHLPNPKEPKLWYGIGILYDRYGSLEHAEEAFASVVRMDPNYEKANEIYFRLGIIYKQQNKYQHSLECFRYILSSPPRPLTEIDIWFQIGHVYEQQKDFGAAKDAYERVLAENPHHAKVLQQLGWLYHQSSAGFQNQERAIQFLTKSLESDANDAQSWYLLGRAYMAGQNYNKAYEAYQQAVYRDGKNPTFWCSIGVLYYQINQFRDALDAYSRAIRLNPYISEVWFDLGSLYESCNNQISDAIDAYARAAELDPDNPHIQQRLNLLRNAEAKGEQVSSAPIPQDVHPTAYASVGGAQPPGPPSRIGANGNGPSSAAFPPQGLSGPDGGPMRELPGPKRSPSPPQGFRGGRPPSIPNIDDRGTKSSSHATLAPMDAPPINESGRSPPQHHRFPHERTSPGPRGFNQPGPPGPLRQWDGNGRNNAYDREREHDGPRDREQEGHSRRGYGGAPRGSHLDEHSGHSGFGPPPPPIISGSGRYDPLNDRSEPTRHSDAGSHNGEPTRETPFGDSHGSASKRKAGRRSAKPKTEAPGPSPSRRKANGSSRSQSPGSSRPASTFGGSRGGVRSPDRVKTRMSPTSDRGSPAGSDASSGSRPLAAGLSASHAAQRSQAPVASRSVDEDYDNGAADALMGLAGAASASSSLPARPPTLDHPASRRTASPPAKGGLSADSMHSERARSAQPAARFHSADDAQDASRSQQNAAPIPDDGSNVRASSILGKRPNDDTDSRSAEVSPRLTEKRARNVEGGAEDDAMEVDDRVQKDAEGIKSATVSSNTGPAGTTPSNSDPDAKPPALASTASVAPPQSNSAPSPEEGELDDSSTERRTSPAVKSTAAPSGDGAEIEAKIEEADNGDKP